MTTEQIRGILNVIVDDARVPTVSFTGGEPTLHPDLPELIAYAKSRKLRTDTVATGRMQRRKAMNAKKTIQYMDDQSRAIEELIAQLDEIQVEFNAQYDEFKTWHDARLDTLTEKAVENLAGISAELRAAIEDRVPGELQALDERRAKIRDEYLPARKEAADGLLADAQEQLTAMRALNPRLDAREEELKAEKAQLEANLEELNEEIRKNSRGLGVVLHFIAITKADRQRHHILGQLEALNSSLHHVRLEWQREQDKVESQQEAYQETWQLESIAVARLQSELDQLDDRGRRELLALQRAAHKELDAIKEPSPGPIAELNAGLQEMIDLNIQTDAYHEGLASVGGLIGMLRGIDSGMGAIHKSIEGLYDEQRMHSAYLKALNFDLPANVDAFHQQWPALSKQFSDEEAIGQSPTEFAANVKPILEGPLAQDRIEAMFNDLGKMIERATAGW